MTRSVFAASVVLAVSACGDMPRQLDYTTQKRTRIEAPIEAFGIGHLDVYESPRHPQRLWIEPTPGRGMALVLNGRQDRWAAMRPEIEPVYRAAAVTFLTGEHPACTIESGTPYPDALAFEFTYSCP